jgi:hypothetical protein
LQLCLELQHAHIRTTRRVPLSSGFLELLHVLLARLLPLLDAIAISLVPHSQLLSERVDRLGFRIALCRNLGKQCFEAFYAGGKVSAELLELDAMSVRNDLLVCLKATLHLFLLLRQRCHGTPERIELLPELGHVGSPCPAPLVAAPVAMRGTPFVA